jgi:hypothetical protein
MARLRKQLSFDPKDWILIIIIPIRVRVGMFIGMEIYVTYMYLNTSVKCLVKAELTD